MDAWVWSFLLLGIGVLIIGIEMFVPSGGVLGVLSGLAVLGAIVLAFASSAKFGACMVILVSFLLPAILAVAIRYWPDTPIGRLIMIRPPSSEEILPDAENRRNLKALIGRRGIAKCLMLPGGVVVVDGVSYDAVAGSTSIESGQAVRVVAVAMNRLEVRLDEHPETPDSRPTDSNSPPGGSGSSLWPAPGMVESVEDILSRPIESLGLDALDDPLK